MRLRCADFRALKNRRPEERTAHVVSTLADVKMHLRHVRKSACGVRGGEAAYRDRSQE